MRIGALALFAAFAAQAGEALRLGNDAWPPFVMEGAEQGTAEKLVCEALARSGSRCEIGIDEWPAVLEGARSGALDGIAAVWKSSGREVFLRFSEPYLTNRMIAVTRAGRGFDFDSLSQLSGMRVALVRQFAYGEAVEAARAGWEVLEVDSDLAGMHAVRLGQAHVAIVDELMARQYVDTGRVDEVELGDEALAIRELHFAVSRATPGAEGIIDRFNRSFQAMLADGTVNEILGLDWLLADLGNDGRLEFVLRPSAMPGALEDPLRRGVAYACRQKDLLEFTRPDWDPASARYRVGGLEHDSLAAALAAAFGRERVCGDPRWSGHVPCVDAQPQ